MTAVKIVKWRIAWQKIHFADFVRDANSVASFSPSASISLETHIITSHKHALAAKYGFKMAASEVEVWTSLVTNLSRTTGTF